MEKKTTRRIIGILVVVALVIILLPLMFNGPENQSPIQASEAKAPPFPGTEVEANAATDNNNMIPPSQSGALINRIITPSSSQQAPAAAMAETVASNTSQSLSQGNDQANRLLTSAENLNMISPEDLNSPASPAAATAPMLTPINDLTTPTNAGENVIVIDSDGDGSTTTLTKALAQADLAKSEVKPATVESEVAPTQARATVVQAQPAPFQTAANAPAPIMTPTLAQAAPTATAPAATNPVVKSVVAALTKTVSASKEAVTKTKEAVTRTKKVAASKSIVTPSKRHADTTTITDLKKAAWIVQLGSFKNKLNAERLTNSLRAKGYKAFTLETKSNGQTRVCVGPEFKQIAAASLASKIESDINMHGIVMTYQPLAL